MNTKQLKKDLPLVYSCSGCSNIGQLANRVAVELDRADIAEMSCIAGVGGGVENLVNKAKSGQSIISLDGCQQHCVKACLTQQDIQSTHHFTLTELGIKKRAHKDYLPGDVDTVINHVLGGLRKTA